MRAGENSALAPLLKAALQAAGRGVALIQSLLAFARKQRLDPRSLDLGGLVTGIEELLRRTLGPAVRLVITADPDLAPAHVDANQVELAILNLTINARDAMPEGGTMRIALDNRHANGQSPPELTSGDYVVVSISDDGTGMDEATLAQVFEPFFTTKEAGSGSGLGLSMVHGFAGQSGGTVGIRSKPGMGTTVELWLPKADEPASSTLVERSVMEISRGTGCTLLCDDDDDVRLYLSDFLRSIGYTVHEASGAEAAIHILESRPEVDLLIVDYAMPGMNGIETIRRARLRRPDLRSLLITGYASVPTNAGVPVLRKPFAPNTLALRVAELLAAS
jgi:CheY-like chemotaxis protein